MLIRRYRSVLANDPRETFAFQRLVDLYRERDGNVERLLDELRQEVSASAEAYAPRMLLGHLLKARGDAAGARQRYEEAAALEPSQPAPALALGQQALGSGDFAGARKYFERALELMRKDEERREVVRKLGEVALQQSDFDGARGYYEQLARSSQGNVYLRTEFARALGQRGHHARAIDEYDRVIAALHGDNRVLVPVLRDKGRAELEAGKLDQAIATLDRALHVAGRQSALRSEILDALVDVYRRGERLAQLAEKLEREGARDFHSTELLGRIHDELGNESEALAAYRRAVKLDRRHIDTRLKIIQLLSRSGHLDEVVAEYRELVRVAPREPRFVVELAKLLMQTGRGDEARRLARDTSRRHRREASVHEALASLYAAWGDHERATEEVSQLVRIDPRDAAHLVALGEQQLDRGDVEGAKATWKRILTAEGDRARAHATIALVLLDHAMYADAELHYRAAVKLAPDHVDYVRGLATVIERDSTDRVEDAREARDREAVSLWQRVIALAAADRASGREARRRIVGIWARRQQLPAKIAEWKVAFERAPPDLEAGRLLGEAYLVVRPRQLDKASAALGAVVARAPGDVETLLALEHVRSVAGDLSGAIEILKRLVDADPRRASGYLSRMAEHAHALYRDEEAVRFAAMAVERTPNDANAHRRLGDLYRARQDVEHAIASYRRAIELNDRLFMAYFDLAALHRLRGELVEADTLYRRIVRTTTDDELVAVAARESLQFHLATGTLETLEADLLPLALSQSRRPIFRRLVVELYDAYATPRIESARVTGPGAERARDELRRLGVRAIKPLLEALADEAPTQRRVAVDLLGALGNDNAAGPLLSVAEGEGSLDLRTRALFGAGVLLGPDTPGGDKLMTRLVALATGSERQLRAVATWAVAQRPTRSALSHLEKLARHGDSQVRAFAILGLGAGRHQPSRPMLVELLQSDPNAVVRAAVSLALAALGGAEPASALTEAATQGGIVGRAAIVALGSVEGSSARATLARVFFSPDAAERRAAMAALGGRSALGARLPSPARPLGAKEYVEWLLDRADREATVAPGALAAELSDAARDALAGPLEQVYGALRALDAPSMEAILRPPLTADLVLVLGHPDPMARALAARVAGRMTTPQATAALVRALGDRETSVRQAVLASMGPAHVEALPSIAAASRQDAEWSIRLRAVQALARVGGARALPALQRVLQADSYALVREAAVVGLASLGPAALDALLLALGDPEPQVWRPAVVALRQIEDPRAREALSRRSP